MVFDGGLRQLLSKLPRFESYGFVEMYHGSMLKHSFLLHHETYRPAPKPDVSSESIPCVTGGTFTTHHNVTLAFRAFGLNASALFPKAVAHSQSWDSPRSDATKGQPDTSLTVTIAYDDDSQDETIKIKAELGTKTLLWMLSQIDCEASIGALYARFETLFGVGGASIAGAKGSWTSQAEWMDAFAGLFHVLNRAKMSGLRLP